jgi:chemotaxis protein MotB
MKWPAAEPTSDRTPDWLITYSDLMTLLLVMFVLLFSLSEFKQSEKFLGVARSMHRKFGHPDRLDEQTAELEVVASENLRAALRQRDELLSVTAAGPTR